MPETITLTWVQGDEDVTSHDIRVSVDGSVYVSIGDKIDMPTVTTTYEAALGHTYDFKAYAYVGIYEQSEATITGVIVPELIKRFTDADLSDPGDWANESGTVSHYATGDGDGTATYTFDLENDLSGWSSGESVDIYMKLAGIAGEAESTVTKIIVNETTAASSASFPPEMTYIRDTSPTGLNLPAYLTPMADPDAAAYANIERITDSGATGLVDDIRHEYSKKSAFNSDGSLIRTQFEKHVILSGTTYAYLNDLTYGDASPELAWSNVDPDVLYYISRITRKFYSKNPITQAETQIYDFSGTYSNTLSIGNWEGSIDNNDKYIVFNTSSGSDLIVIVFDVQDKSIVTTKTFSGRSTDLNYCQISQSGTYVIFGWDAPATATEVYLASDLSFQRKLIDYNTHGDCGYDQSGNEVLVGTGYTGLGPEGIWSMQLNNGTTKVHITPYCGGHTSCRNINRPGWAYTTTDDARGQDVMAVKLDETETVQRFCFSRAENTDSEHYSHNVMGCPNPNGDKVIFASDFGDVNNVYDFITEMAP